MFLDIAHPSWHLLLNKAFTKMDVNYLESLKQDPTWLPGLNQLLAAFSLPLSDVKFILLGESPYPRALSANGYAFWDARVKNIWSESGLSKEVNRATSLRNIIKMLLHARGDLINNFSQDAIKKLDKTKYVKTIDEFFKNFLKQGFLLLNATLVYPTENTSNLLIKKHARAWRVFIHVLLLELAKNKPKLILLGNIAKEIPEQEAFDCVIAEHPYNLSFITNPNVIAFFKPLDLLFL